MSTNINDVPQACAICGKVHTSTACDNCTGLACGDECDGKSNATTKETNKPVEVMGPPFFQGCNHNLPASAWTTGPNGPNGYPRTEAEIRATTERTCDRVPFCQSPGGSCRFADSDKCGYPEDACLRSDDLGNAPRPAAQDADECNAFRYLNGEVNRVTAMHRHGQKVSNEMLVRLCNAQIDAEHMARNRRPSRPMSADGVPVELFPSFSELLESIDKGESATEWERGFAAGVIKASEAAKNRPVSAELKPGRFEVIEDIAANVASGNRLAAMITLEKYVEASRPMISGLDKANKHIENAKKHLLKLHNENEEDCQACKVLNSLDLIVPALKEKV